MLLNCDAGEDSWESLELQGDNSILKEISPEYSLERQVLNLRLQYYAHLMQRTNSLEKTLMSQFFASGGQSIRISASASVLPMTTQDWFPLVWTGIHHYVYINIVHYQAKWCKIILLPIFDFLCFMESFFKFNFYFILEYSWFTVSH